MNDWTRRIRGAIGMGLVWAFGWAVGGLMIGVASKITPFLPWHYFFDVFDAPLPAMALPGFIGGALFSVVLGVAGRGRRFTELSLPRFVTWGALGGVLVALVPVAMVATGLGSTEGGSTSLGYGTAVFSVAGALLGGVSAFGTLKLARLSAQSEPQQPVT